MGLRASQDVVVYIGAERELGVSMCKWIFSWGGVGCIPVYLLVWSRKFLAMGDIFLGCTGKMSK